MSPPPPAPDVGTPPTSVSAVILAGGKSRRMGSDKAVLSLGGKPLLLHVLGAMAGVADQIVIAGRAELAFETPGAILVPDEIPDAGPLGGLAAGLRAIPAGVALVTGCDYPFLQRPLLRHLVEHLREHEAVVPVVGGRPQPTVAAYRRNILPAALAQIEQGDYRFESLLQTLSVRWLNESEIERFDPHHLSFFNVNTPAAWEEARNLSSG